MKVIYTIIITLAFILLIVIGGIRFCLTHFFIDLEYNSPHFPDDPYGFSKSLRTKYAYASVDYLLGKISTDEFSNLQLPNGNPLFNEREVSHMQDVRKLTQLALHSWYGSMVVIFIGMFIARPLQWWSIFLKAGRIAAITIFALIVLI